MRVAIVHDWLVGGGAERVVEELHKLYPEAPIYTSYATKEWRDRLDGKVKTGYLQKAPYRQLRKFLPVLRQRWFRGLDLSRYDLVISSSGNGEARFVTVKEPAMHISYCHSPTHFYWRHYEEYVNNPSFRPKWLARLGLKILIKPLRKKDFEAAQKVDFFIANSSHIKDDIKQYYGRDSVVIHPPINTGRFAATAPKGRHGFVTVGRQVPYKKTALIIEACNRLKIPLTVSGRGPENAALKRLAGPTVLMLDYVPDEEVPGLMASAEAFIFAAFEDFGMTPVEAMAAGTPVIAYQAGGALVYVIPGKTGEFFDNQTVGSLVSTLKNFKSDKYDHDFIAKHAQKFSSENFQKKFKSFIDGIT